MDVTATSRDGLASSETIVTVDMSSPSLTFYRNDPLYGPLFNNAVNDNLYLGSQRETGVLAVPFGFSVSTAELNNLTFKWLINGTLHPELSSNQSITLRAPDNQAGSSNIDLTVNYSKDILQQSESVFSTIWNTSASSSSSKSVTF